MATYTYSGGKFVPVGGGTTIDPAGGFTSTLVGKDAANKTRILTAGHSMVLGQGSAPTGGFRMALWQKLSDAGFQFTPVGWNTTNPLQPYDVSYAYRGTGHASYGGWKIQDLLDQTAGRTGRAAGNPLGTDGIGAWITTYNPDLLIVVLGTNDTTDTAAVRQQAMTDFVNAVFNAKSNIKVLWGTMIYQQNNQTTYPVNTEWEAAWGAKTGKTIIKADNAAAVGTATGNFSDMIHPSMRGYDRMASSFFQAIVNN